jgi:branched-chain amino acid transport system substrate-binding protein
MSNKDHSRRKVLGVLGSTGTLALAGCTGPSDNGSSNTGTSNNGSSNTVKIGAPHTLSGQFAYYGKISIWPFFAGFAYKAGEDPISDFSEGTKTVTVNEVDYDILLRDTEFSPDKAQSIASNLVENEDIDILGGTANSRGVLRMAETVARPSGVTSVFGPGATTAISSNGDVCGDNTFRVGESTGMVGRTVAEAVLSQDDVENVYLFGADYSYGQTIAKHARAVLEENGINIVGERFVPQGHSEWEGLLNQAEEAGADMISNAATIASFGPLINSYLNGDYSFKVTGEAASLLWYQAVSSTIQEALGEPITQAKLDESGLGPFSFRGYWNQYDNEYITAMNDIYRDNYGRLPDVYACGMFTTACAIVEAVEEAGSTDGEDIAEALRGMTVTETPKGKGEYVMQEYNNQARAPMTAGMLAPTSDENSEYWDAAVQPGETVATITKDRTTIPADSEEMGCSL